MMRQRCRYKFYASSLLLIYEGEVRTGPRPPAVADPEPVAVAAPVAAQPQPLTPPPRTKCTRRVPHPVLIGHAASLTLHERERRARVPPALRAAVAAATAGDRAPARERAAAAAARHRAGPEVFVGSDADDDAVVMLGSEVL